MKQAELLYVIRVGDSADWQAGRGGLYYVLDDKGEKGVPVFSEPKRAERYVEAKVLDPDAHLEHKLGDAAPDYVRALAEGRLIIERLECAQVVQAAASVGAHYLIRDARPGQQEAETVRIG
jgi:hypothetical protein